jgi:two-component system sensor kinase FixL
MYGVRRVKNRLLIASGVIAITLVACGWLIWDVAGTLARGASSPIGLALALVALLAIAGMLAYSARLVLISSPRDTEVQLEGIIDSVADAIISVDSGQRVLLFNPAAERMFGIEAAAALGEPLARFIPHRFRDAHAEHVRRFEKTSLTKRRMGALGALRALRANGEEFPIEASISQTLVAGERVLTVVLRDISERMRIESELQATQVKLAHIARLSTMGEMASGLAHEINQPLTAIATYAQALENLLRAEEALDRETIREVLRQISSQALRAGEVIRRLRTMIKGQEPVFRTLDCKELLHDVFALADIDARLHRVELRTDADCNGARIRGDAVQLQQVLINLVRNAIDALEELPPDALEELPPDALEELPPERRRITIGLSVADEAAEFRVVDRGNGVSPDALQKMFSPFYTTKPHGTGLGLAISRSIIEAHRGRLRYERTPGGGATFSFTIPLQVAEVAREVHPGEVHQ